MAPRKLYPMPVQTLYEHPAYRAAPAAAVGMLHRLLEHFWLTDCRPLPIAEDQLFAISRAHRPTWRHHKAEILRIFSEIAPDLAAYWTLRQNKATTIRFVSATGGAATQAKAALASVRELAAPAPMPVAPTREPAKPPRPAAPDNRQRPRMTDAA